MEIRKVKLLSGAELAINPAPFRDGRALYQSVFSESRALRFDPTVEVDVNFKKDVWCVMLASKLIEEALWKCFERCTYNGLKITEDTFEPVEARGDYFELCMEVGMDNIAPFMKGLSAEFGVILSALKPTSPA